MGIFDRLGEVIKSYLNDEDTRLFPSGNQDKDPFFGDPDLKAAYEELNDFLGDKKKPRGSNYDFAKTEFRRTEYTRTKSGGTRFSRTEYTRTDYDAGKKSGKGETKYSYSNTSGKLGAETPETLRSDFAELGVPFGAGPSDCKASYKKLLKIHHPDRHAGHPGNMQKATEKSARINAAYDKIEKWRATGKTE